MAAMVALLRPPHASSAAASAAGPSSRPVRHSAPSTASNALLVAEGPAHAWRHRYSHQCVYAAAFL